jgi:hypothetical protein
LSFRRLKFVERLHKIGMISALSARNARNHCYCTCGASAMARGQPHFVLKPTASLPAVNVPERVTDPAPASAFLNVCLCARNQTSVRLAD